MMMVMVIVMTIVVAVAVVHFDYATIQQWLEVDLMALVHH